ncbi:MAG: pyridoxal-phosphate dependent enzyme [Rhodobacteraceae bacterium]|nr:pyridoxal-phosphate dependent enzyme [Paracoccaceae bacterium]
MEYLTNPWRGTGLPKTDDLVAGTVSDDPELVQYLLGLCPAYKPTPLVLQVELADELGLAGLMIKDERQRMGLGSFKALGAAFAIAKQAHRAKGDALADPDVARSALKGETFVTASAGNHGLSVAAGARIFGARAVIYLAETVPAGFADRLRGIGADVVVEGADYEASMVGAAKAAADNGWTLLSDSTWNGCTTGQDVMEGYLAMASEIATQSGDDIPTHVFLQAGVGGLAAGVTAYLRKIWGAAPQIIVVEPAAAPALYECIKAGKFVAAEGPSSNMGRLDCKEASHLALKCLAEQADGFMLLSDDYVAETIARLEPLGLVTSPSGGAGYAGAVAAVVGGVAGVDGSSRVLVILSEGPADE